MISLLMMVKNEEKYAVRTLDSVSHFIDSFVILDTGSTDNTRREIEQWCKVNQKNLALKIVEFVDFATTRNELLRFASSNGSAVGQFSSNAACRVGQWYLLMDANDEFRGDGHAFIQLLKKKRNVDGLLMQQVWHFSSGDTKYNNIRCIFVASHAKRWHYVGIVHEYITVDDSIVESCPPEIASLYQDRTDDGGKSATRFKKDCELLLASDLSNARNVFYLARTCDALGMREEAVKYFEKRAQQNGFLEEVFCSYLALGRLHKVAKRYRDAATSFLAAFETNPRRVESLVELGHLYRETKQWNVAFLFLERALALPDAEDSMLFAELEQWEYIRWHLMGIVAFYANEMRVGREACMRAIAASRTEEERIINENNLKFYLV